MSDSTVKSTRWAFTAYEGQWNLFKAMPPEVSQWGWQEETCPRTGRLHYQGYMILRRQFREKGARALFPGVHMEIARNWNDLVRYCQKPETRVEGAEQVHRTNDIPSLFGYAEEISSRLPSWEEVKRKWWQRNEFVSWLMRHAQPDLPMPVPKDSIYYCPSTFKEFAYDLVCDMVAEDIRSGRRGIEFIVQNPLWITTFKNQIDNIIHRQETLSRQTDRQTEPVEVSFP